MFENGIGYPALSNRGHAVKFNVDNASRKIATFLTLLMKKAKQDKNLSLAHHETNVTVMEDSISYLVFKDLPPHDIIRFHPS